ncbi:cilia- and flagella-associated protein 300-like [Ptychodera flava]|uniref:cilia- and flagella-associated protein 300-like n=1 Tax=Ptychodera flava TaxID=63121 RepID=UPI003969BD82
MAASSEKRERQFSFTPLEGKRVKTLEDKETQDLLMKWNLKDRLTVQFYSFNNHFQSYLKDDFFLDFFQDPNVFGTLQAASDSGSFGPIGTAASKVEVTSVPCTILSMTFFDRLYTEGIVRDSDQICKCFDEYHEGIQISDELRKMLLLEDSDNYEEYSDDEREQFLFRLFQHLCIGGPVCQFEDSIKPYLNTTKSLYKDLISVQKDPNTKQLNITSLVYSLNAQDKDGYSIYPADKEHIQTFAYAVVDPLKRQVAILYHKYGGGFW